MGDSEQAKLFYGFTVESEEYDDDEAYERQNQLRSRLVEADKFYACTQGIKEPTEPYPGTGTPKEEANRIQEMYRKYWNDKQEVYSASKCVVEYYNSCYETEYFVTVTESLQEANWGEIIYPDLRIKEDWDNLLTEFCAHLEIPLKEFRWCMVSYYG